MSDDDDKETVWTDYTCMWSIQLSARSAREAARLALDITRDPNSVATVFRIENVATKESVLMDAETGRVFDTRLKTWVKP